MKNKNVYPWVVVGVAMDTIKELKGQLTTKQYKGFVGR